MAQPSPVAHARAAASLRGPFYDQAAADAAWQRGMQLTDVVRDLTNPGPVPDFLRSSRNPFVQEVATRTEVVNGRRVPSMYYNIEPARKVEQALSAARAEQEIVRAALALFSGNGIDPQPAVYGPYRQQPAPAKSMVGPMALLADLLTTSSSLNSNESAALEKIHGKDVNKMSFEELLNKAVSGARQ